MFNVLLYPYFRRDERPDSYGRDVGKNWNNRNRRDRGDRDRNRKDERGSRDRRDNFRARGSNNRNDRNRGRFRDEDRDSSTGGRRNDSYGRRDKHSGKRNDYNRYSRDRDRVRDNESSTHRRNDSPKRRDDRSASPKQREVRDNSHHRSQTSQTSSTSTASDAVNRPESSQPAQPTRTFANDFLTRNQRRVNEKLQQLQKMGIEIPNVTTPQLPFPQPKPLMETVIAAASLIPQPVPTTTTGGIVDFTNFTSPVLVNAKYTEQNQKKKLIWGSKKEQFEKAVSASDGAGKPVTNNKWETATFSQDNDGKVASKFLRLMGMKGEAVKATPVTSDNGSESGVKKREEMFSTMEQQYEVARQATHTMRGMGLGFGSQPRSF